jgi:hypothetical protein
VVVGFGIVGGVALGMLGGVAGGVVAAGGPEVTVPGALDNDWSAPVEDAVAAVMPTPGSGSELELQAPSTTLAAPLALSSKKVRRDLDRS